MSNVVFFSNNVWFFLSHCVILNSFRELIFIFSKRILILFFITPRHPKLDSGSLFIFFKKDFDSFFLSLLYFYIFIKITTTSLRGRNQLRVRSPLFWIWVIYSGYIFPYDSGSPLPVSPRRSGAKLGRFTCGNPLLLKPLSPWARLRTPS